MITNFWGTTKFYCINKHDEPIEMKVMEGTSPFYACPYYMRQDEAHPDGHPDDCPACNNRISFAVTASIMDKMMKAIEKSEAEGEMGDYTGMQITYGGVSAKILRYDTKNMKVGILNRKAVEG